MRIVTALLVIAGLLCARGSASAAVWAWGCQGRLGDEQVVFNRYNMAIYKADKSPPGDLKRLIDDDIKTPPGTPSERYEPQDVNGGFSETMVFVRPDDAKRKLTLTEKSSKRTSHRAKLICGRDETTDLFRKVYRYEREDAPARDITMQCMEYQLSTRGGRKGCD